MNRIHIKKFGFSCGITGVLLYVGCAIVMAVAGRETSIQFFNALFHGVNTASIIRMNVSPTEAFMGVIETFILFWLIGACIAAFYNVLNRETYKA
ncbi:hypothetical protein A3860_34380 [Niastella vici]|uniref:Uncharacterized protein n=1 Tax=Niastella vici TaxID=1703345 RepID=A0A1V9FPA7_9BACT|nr:DUF5676 family membrane protein [Niastella vici]OQP60170.1 hypothetical protein A3860_34380 [Niastella vici]